MNNVIISGRLVRDPELRYIPQSETAVAKFTVAVDRPMSKEKTADFIPVVAFGKTAELCEKYTAKGKRILIQGRIQTGSYDKDGEKRYTTDVIAERVEFIDWKEKSEADGVPEGFQQLDDDDIPF